MAERGVIVSCETIRCWCFKFGPQYAKLIGRKHGRLGNVWHVDELFVRIQGRQVYLWRAVDQDGDVLDILVTKHCDKQAAKHFFRKVLEHQGQPPWKLITDRLKTYPAAHGEVFPSVRHRTAQYENNRAEVSHPHTREKERRMRRFRSVPQAQQLLAVQGSVQNLFRVGQQHLRADNHRLLRDRAFAEWKEVICIC